ncbi:hypothetical protein JCM10550A_05450 [Methanogenium cariaci]
MKWQTGAVLISSASGDGFSDLWGDKKEGVKKDQKEKRNMNVSGWFFSVGIFIGYLF